MFPDAIQHARDWFRIHADQRLKLMNFFVILLAGALALFGVAIKDSIHSLEILVSISFLVITYTFKNLDRRTAFLIKDAEQALSILEQELSTGLGFDEVRLINAAESKRGVLSYRQSFNCLFALGYLIGSFGVIHGVWPYINDVKLPICDFGLVTS